MAKTGSGANRTQKEKVIACRRKAKGLINRIRRFKDAGQEVGAMEEIVVSGLAGLHNYIDKVLGIDPATLDETR